MSDRTYECDVCGLKIDRDLNAAINILTFGSIKVGLVRSELTPVEIATSSLNGIYPYKQGSVYESGRNSDASAKE